jgi:phospho-N-acetylmuramoyl-pentapeptide-transferase
MIYHLIKYLDLHFDFAGARLIQYLSFRAAAAVIVSLVISMVMGKHLIGWLRRKQVGETIRDLGLDGQMQKTGTPTMGGIIILMSIIIPTLLFADLTNVYIQTLLIATVWLGIIGFMDDYIKVFKKDKEGLAGKFKIIGQIGAGVIVASMLYWNPTVTNKERTDHQATTSETVEQTGQSSAVANWEENKNIKTTIPFIKDNEFDYSWLLPASWRNAWSLWIVFTLVVILIVMVKG